MERDCDETSEGVAPPRPIASAAEITAIVMELQGTLSKMDALGLGVAANHVSQGLEILRERTNSLGNGDNI